MIEILKSIGLILGCVAQVWLALLPMLLIFLLVMESHAKKQGTRLTNRERLEILFFPAILFAVAFPLFGGIAYLAGGLLLGWGEGSTVCGFVVGGLACLVGAPGAFKHTLGNTIQRIKKVEPTSPP